MRSAAFTRVGKINDAAKIYGDVVDQDGLDSIELERAGHELADLCSQVRAQSPPESLNPLRNMSRESSNQRVAFFSTLRGAKVPPGIAAKDVQEEVAGSSSVAGQSGK